LLERDVYHFVAAQGCAVPAAVLTNECAALELLG
jgi:hypothetical protein